MSGLLLGVLALISGGQRYTEDQITTEPVGEGFGGGGAGVRDETLVLPEPVIVEPYVTPYVQPYDPYTEYEAREQTRFEEKFAARAKLEPDQPTSVTVGKQQKKIMSIGRDPDQYTLEPYTPSTPYVVPVKTKTTKPSLYLRSYEEW